MGEEHVSLDALDEPYRSEIARRIDEGFDFDGTVERFSKEFYALQPNGFMLRSKILAPFVKRELLESTILDIVFCRQSDIHYHTKIGELVTVLSGEGKFYFENPDNDTDTRSLGLSTTSGPVYVPPKVLHAFVPEPGTYLEIHLVTLGGRINEDGDEEIQIVPFNEWNLKT